MFLNGLQWFQLPARTSVCLLYEAATRHLVNSMYNAPKVPRYLHEE